MPQEFIQHSIKATASVEDVAELISDIVAATGNPSELKLDATEIATFSGFVDPLDGELLTREKSSLDLKPGELNAKYVAPEGLEVAFTKKSVSSGPYLRLLGMGIHLTLQGDIDVPGRTSPPYLSEKLKEEEGIDLAVDWASSLLLHYSAQDDFYYVANNHRAIFTEPTYVDVVTMPQRSSQ